MKDDYRPASTHKNHLAVSDMTFKGFFKGLGQAFKYLLTPNWGSKRRAEQQAYEDRLDEAMNRAQAEKGAKAES